jgi:hypothetical protein
LRERLGVRGRAPLLFVRGALAEEGAVVANGHRDRLHERGDHDGRARHRKRRGTHPSGERAGVIAQGQGHEDSPDAHKQRTEAAPSANGDGISASGSVRPQRSKRGHADAEATAYVQVDKSWVFVSR